MMVRLGRNGETEIPECGYCGKRHQIKRIITDYTLLSYICGRCNRKHHKMVQKVAHATRGVIRFGLRRRLPIRHPDGSIHIDATMRAIY